MQGRRDIDSDTVFFTDPDPDLQQTGSRDPLGFEILWTHFGGRVVPHFSTVSRGATNFGVCLTVLWLVDTYLESRDIRLFHEGSNRRPARDGLLVAAETLSVLSALREFGRQLPGAVLGSQNGRRRLEHHGGAPPVGPFAGQQLLTRQLGLGVFGRYRGALNSMDLFDERTHLTDSARIALTDTFDQLRPLQSLVHDFFDRLVASDDHTCPFEVFADARADGKTGAEWMADLRGERIRRSFAPALVDAAEVAPSCDTLIRRIYERVEPVHSGAADTDALLLELEQNLDDRDERERVRDVRRIEELLQRFDRLFDHLWAVDRLDESRLASIIEELWEHVDDLEILLARATTSGMVRRRLEGLAKVLEQPTPLGVIGALVEQYHRDIVAESRGANPWVSIESGRVTVLNDGRPHGRPYGLDVRR